MGRRGWWADHTFHKRTISEDFSGWMGWYPPKDRPKQMAFVPLIHSLEGDQKNLLLSLFFCGSRANEILLAEGRHFKVKDKVVDVSRLPAFTKKEGMHWQVGDLIEKGRWFYVNRSEPLVDEWIEFFEDVGETERLFDFKYGKLYKLITSIKWREKNANLFPHRIRAERASQLTAQYRASKFELKGFFAWTRDKTPDFYVKLARRDQLRMYGIEEEVVIEPEPSPNRQPKDKSLPISTEVISEISSTTLKAEKKGGAIRSGSVEKEIEEILKGGD